MPTAHHTPRKYQSPKKNTTSAVLTRVLLIRAPYHVCFTNATPSRKCATVISMGMRPFSNQAVLHQMLQERRDGWSTVALAKKYGVSSHRPILYQCKKHGIGNVVLSHYYHPVPTAWRYTIRKAVRDFPLGRVTSRYFRDMKLTEKIAWHSVEQHLIDTNFRTKPMIVVYIHD